MLDQYLMVTFLGIAAFNILAMAYSIRVLERVSRENRPSRWFEYSKKDADKLLPRLRVAMKILLAVTACIFAVWVVAILSN